MALVDVGADVLGVEWCAALYESWHADTDPEMPKAYAAVAHRLCEELEREQWERLAEVAW